MFFSAAIIFSVMACAWFFGPFGPERLSRSDDRADHPQAGLLLPVAVRDVGPAAAIDGNARSSHWARWSSFGFLILLPFLSGEGEKSWKRRPIAVVTLLLIAVALGTFTKLATYSPWSPVMNGWSGDPVPVEFSTDGHRWNGKARWSSR